MILQSLVIRYVIFAFLATVGNLATQRAFLQLGKTDILFALAISAGTVIGLIIKYYLDKRWIFYDVETGMKNNSWKFTLYTAMGILTTAIFWGTETAFWLTWQTDVMRELGAIIGLVIGYLTKYHLDKRYVFRTEAA